MQSLVASLSLNNLIPFTIIFSSVYLSLNKISTPLDWQKKYPSGLAKTRPLRIGKNSTYPDWQKQYPSGLAKIVLLRFGKNSTPLDLAKLGPFRIGKIGTPPNWQNWDPSGLAKLGPLRIGKIGTLRIGKNGTLPDWYPSGSVIKAFQRLSKFSPITLPDKFSDAIMLFELTRKGVGCISFI